MTQKWSKHMYYIHIYTYKRRPSVQTQNTYIPKMHSKPSKDAQKPRKTAFCVFDHFLMLIWTDVAYMDGHCLPLIFGSLKEHPSYTEMAIYGPI